MSYYEHDNVVAFWKTTSPLPRIVPAVHHDESGQITLLFVFASIAFVLLLGFILNSAKQTSRKVQMQGASDAAAVSGGIWMARGMNLMVLNNKGMADVLAVMIAEHSAAQTAQAMPKLILGLIASLAPFAEVPAVAAMIARLRQELVAWKTIAGLLASVDQKVIPLGWDVMHGIDRINQAVKASVPKLAEAETVSYGHANGADESWLFSKGLTPAFPVGRGGKEFLAIQAQNCSLKGLTGPTKAALTILCAVRVGPCISSFLAWPVFDHLVDDNVSSLSGGKQSASQGHITRSKLKQMKDGNGVSIEKMIDDYNQAHDTGDGKFKPKKIDDILKSAYNFVFGTPLRWPSDPPYPMLLTDQPLPDGGAMIPDATADIDLLRVQKYLQFLAASRAALDSKGTIASNRFINPAPYGWLTYAEADVYNPSTWNMFNQNWRVKLARSVLLNEKAADLLQKANVRGIGNLLDFSFVNTH